MMLWQGATRSTLCSLLLMCCLSQAETACSAEVLFKPYRPHTGIAGIPFQGPPAHLAKPVNGVRYSLEKGPSELLIDEKTGASNWAIPKTGRHVIRIKATAGEDSDIVEWILRVVPKYADDVLVYSTEHIDFVITRRQLDGTHYLKRKKMIDAKWKTYAALVGQEPQTDRQVYLWDPKTPGARAGNPAHFGGDRKGNAEPIAMHQDWERWGYSHELAHNFNFLVRTPGTWSKVKEFEGFDTTWLDRYLHHLCNANGAYLFRRAVETPADFGLGPTQVKNLSQWLATGVFGRANERKQARAFKKMIDDGKSMEDAAKDHKGIFGFLANEIMDQHGTKWMEEFFRLIRHDGLPGKVFEEADTSARKFTLLVCLFSEAAEQDLRPLFEQYGFRVEEKYYDKVLPLIRAEKKNLASRTPWNDGWIKCPVSGRSYRVMTTKTDWEQANRTARQWGGRLPEIHSAAEQAWFTKRFVHLGPLWIGLRDEKSTGDWKWVSGRQADFFNWYPNKPRDPNDKPGPYAIMGRSEPTGCWRAARVDRVYQITVIVERDGDK